MQSNQLAVEARLPLFWIIFDVICGIIQIADVSLDIYVTTQYGAGQHIAIYYISLLLLATGFAAFALCFVAHFGGHFSRSRFALSLLLALPLSPLLPTLMWLQTYRLAWLDALFEAVGFDPECRHSICPRVDKFLARQIAAPASTLEVPPPPQPEPADDGGVHVRIQQIAVEPAGEAGASGLIEMDADQVAMLEGMRVISDRQFSLMLETIVEALPQVRPL
jgi:hypothetical protein